MTSLVQVRVLELFRGLLVISVLQVRPDSSLELLDDVEDPNVLPAKPKTSPREFSCPVLWHISSELRILGFSLAQQLYT